MLKINLFLPAVVGIGGFFAWFEILDWLGVEMGISYLIYAVLLTCLTLLLAGWLFKDSNTSIIGFTILYGVGATIFVFNSVPGGLDGKCVAAGIAFVCTEYVASHVGILLFIPNRND